MIIRSHGQEFLGCNCWELEAGPADISETGLRGPMALKLGPGKSGKDVSEGQHQYVSLVQGPWNTINSSVFLTVDLF